eukprot:scaffold12586_cov132-Isochrysis_galbana.AAC.11
MSCARDKSTSQSTPIIRSAAGTEPLARRCSAGSSTVAGTRPSWTTARSACPIDCAQWRPAPWPPVRDV